MSIHIENSRSGGKSLAKAIVDELVAWAALDKFSPGDLLGPSTVSVAPTLSQVVRDAFRVSASPQSRSTDVQDPAERTAGTGRDAARSFTHEELESRRKSVLKEVCGYDWRTINEAKRIAAHLCHIRIDDATPIAMWSYPELMTLLACVKRVRRAGRNRK